MGRGSGRALSARRASVGDQGVVLGADFTLAMLTATAREGRAALARLLLADACRLPLPAGAVHGVFSAALVNHVPDPATALREWARVTAPDGVLLTRLAARRSSTVDPAVSIAVAFPILSGARRPRVWIG
ncbi:class I SAM-dependent methyltransferase [Streptomyces actinomycinicus]|uniref:class I SAM-dependent methyltransferase n=1 Tax=Streptomyces actinomycinicus TaxID=1695166 RepID=UPI0027DA5BED|nr:class I SAM-dependent methyltransferase [Streptomyces actinomycinicus]